MPDEEAKMVLELGSDGDQDLDKLHKQATVKRKLKEKNICNNGDLRFPTVGYVNENDDKVENKTSYPIVSDNDIDFMDVENKNRTKKQIKQMIRYDPLNPDHKKYVIGGATEKTEDSPKKKKKKLKDTQSDTKTTVVRVSKVQYSESFNESLKNIGKETGGFSLSQIVGQTQKDNVSDERIPQNNLQINYDELNFDSGKKKIFQYDSSDSSSEEENEKIDVSYKEKAEHNNNDKNAIKENRFFSTSINDSSIQEAYSFFNPENKKGIEDHSKKRRMLKEIVRKKLRNNTRNLKKKRRGTK
ncbi:uncharacterized protein LOC106658927 [Trichogramma pretiosum]|uniref:uncharacterized protein LOC106658927 n=1 Tax=Trichogramma pretiosum TaxID=7493 RepID=UPI0006C945AB|nr:uncharacterized protein LOC106658927 [Trichogramma pretiosum]